MFGCLKQGKVFYRNLVLLAIPILLQNLITNSLGLIDSVMVGTLGEAPLAAVTIANIPVFIIQLIIFGLQSGSSVLISQYWGKGDTDSINRVVGIGWYTAGGLSLLFALVMTFLPRPLMGILTDNPELVDIAAGYARIVGPSYILGSITGVYIGAHRSMENPRLGFVIFSISMCTDTFLNWVLIFGNLGAPRLGVTGAAVATFTARTVEFLVMAAYAGFNGRFRLNFSAVFRPGPGLWEKFGRYSGPVLLNETLWGTGTSLYKVVMGHMEESTEILAARAVAGNIEDICIVGIFAVAATTAIIVGREIGRNKGADAVYRVGEALNLLSMMLGAAIGLLMLILVRFVLPRWVYPVFNLSEKAAAISNMMLIFTIISLPLRAYNSTNVVGVLRGGGDVRAAMYIDILPMWAVAIPLAALFGLGLKWSIFWVFIGISMEQAVKFSVGVRRFRSGLWINDVTLTT